MMPAYQMYPTFSQSQDVLNLHWVYQAVIELWRLILLKALIFHWDLQDKVWCLCLQLLFTTLNLGTEAGVQLSQQSACQYTESRGFLPQHCINTVWWFMSIILGISEVMARGSEVQGQPLLNEPETSLGHRKQQQWKNNKHTKTKSLSAHQVLTISECSAETDHPPPLWLKS